MIRTRIAVHVTRRTLAWAVTLTFALAAPGSAALRCEHELNGSGEIHECYLEYLFEGCVEENEESYYDCLDRAEGDYFEDGLCDLGFQIDIWECIDDEVGDVYDF